MIKVDIPGFGRLTICHLVLDFNGTLAQDGKLLPGVAEVLSSAAEKVSIHVLTADTHGNAGPALEDLPCTVVILGPGGQVGAKAAYVEGLGAGQVASIGNGRNDRLMLERSALGIAVIQGEGAARETILAAKIICRDVLEAVALIISPLRMTATLRD